jgi:2'-5' RNA ligase
MRIFIAIELPSLVKEELARIQERLKGTRDKIKWVDSSLIHLTLKWVGEIEEKDLEKVVEAAKRVASKFSPFNLEVKGMGAFPSFLSPRVIWIGVNEGKEAVEDLAREIHQELGKEGFSSENKKWVPHLTLGRVKLLLERGKLAEIIQGEKDAKAGRVRVESLSVVRSRLTPQGPIYTTLKRISLRGGEK